VIDPWEFALVALAAWRTWKLLAEDTITEPLRARYIEGHEWRETFTECPWCAGFWVALAWVAAFWVEPLWTVIVAVPFAVSAAVGTLQLIADALTD
jgi:hypothetical protein